MVLTEVDDIVQVGDASLFLGVGTLVVLVVYVDKWLTLPASRRRRWARRR